MRTQQWIVVLMATFVVSAHTAQTRADVTTSRYDALVAVAAVSSDPQQAETAIARLRAIGPAGLEDLFTRHREEIERHIVSPQLKSDDTTKPLATLPVDPKWSRLKHALDAVGAQHDCYASHLYWYTDIEAAKAAARREAKPILSLRLLGHLTDEFSCANSRFFRSTLYPNAEVSRALRERFVLHWKSVRPAPVVTIDFGDGVTLKRTVTGNSIHYVLDSEGRPVDALPGLYGAKVFLAELDRAAQLVAQCKNLDGAARTAALRQYHQARGGELLTKWQEDLRQIAAKTTSTTHELPTTKTSAPRAVAPKSLTDGTVAKARVEAPILSAVIVKKLSAATNDDTWGQIALLHSADAALDEASRQFVAAQNPLAGRAGALAMTKRVVEDPLVALFRNLQQTIAIDTVRNEYLLHRQIHEWFATDPARLEKLDAFNERVYAELFLTPSQDRWYGLLPAGVYSGLANNGICADN